MWLRARQGLGFARACWDGGSRERYRDCGETALAGHECKTWLAGFAVDLQDQEETEEEVEEEEDEDM